MSPTTGPYDGRDRWVAPVTGYETALDVLAAAAEIDYMPPVNPDKARPANCRMVEIPEWLLIAIRIDVASDRDRARGELGLLAPAGSGTARRADAHEKHWRAMHPGYSEFLDWPFTQTPKDIR